MDEIAKAIPKYSKKWMELPNSDEIITYGWMQLFSIPKKMNIGIYDCIMISSIAIL
jgi:hypothetical protein